MERFLVFGSVKALAVDVFGTVVDWRGSLIREGELLAKTKGLRADWANLADVWRDDQRLAMDKVQKGELPWANLDDLHRRIVTDLLKRFRVEGLSEEEIDHLSLAWHRLLPWPDAVGGLNRLRSRYVVATLSNGNLSLLVDLAKNAGLIWDCVLSAELARRYKPDPGVYLTAARLLALAPGQVMMVAAHANDLHAARQVGFKTAFVSRPLEHGPNKKGACPSDAEVDVVATDFLDLALRLGA